MDHSEILRREFDRIAEETDAAYSVMREGEPRGEAVYKEWAGLLLRYHDAIERVTGKEPSIPPRSMKGSPDTDTTARERDSGRHGSDPTEGDVDAVSEAPSMSAIDDARAHTDAAEEPGKHETA